MPPTFKMTKAKRQAHKRFLKMLRECEDVEIIEDNQLILKQEKVTIDSVEEIDVPVTVPDTVLHISFRTKKEDKKNDTGSKV